MKTNNTTAENIDSYIKSFPENIQAILSEIRRTIRKAAPGATEVIKYQIPTFVLKKNLVHFAAFKKHIGFYPTPSAIENFRDKLTAYTCSKGAIQFPLDRAIPYDLISEIVKFRVNQVLGQGK